jgi:hypothetical protein
MPSSKSDSGINRNLIYEYNIYEILHLSIRILWHIGGISVGVPGFNQGSPRELPGKSQGIMKNLPLLRLMNLLNK